MLILDKIFGKFYFENDGKLVKKELRESISQQYEFLKQGKSESNISDKVLLDKCESQLMEYYKQMNYILLSKLQIKDAFSIDNLIIHTINGIEELKKTLNLHSKRLRELFELSVPEVSKKIPDQEKLSKTIVNKNKIELEKEFNITNSCGVQLEDKDYAMIQQLAQSNINIIDLIELEEKYLDEMMKNYCPNLEHLGGSLIAARLIAHIGSLKRLAFLPGSTIQILGAEKALFRHLKSGARGPKYGYLFNHVLVTNAKNKGAMARKLAAKLSICAKIDYNSGEFIADKYLEVLKENEI